ncbi:MAG TPA: hypothetical protein VMG08_07030 [Allosphingosinicella sp.]|nr:hypothetical protein [Allosphingosinicella sp.]
MRLMLTMATGVLVLTGLAACGQNEQSIRSNFRTQALANCQRGADASARAQLSQAGINIDQLCTCAIDRYMQQASLDQLKQDANNPDPPALRATSIQCASELVRQSTPAAAPTPGAAPAPAEPATEGEEGGAESNAAE